MQRLQKRSLPLRMLAYAAAAAAVLAVAVGLGVLVALALDSDGVSLQGGRIEGVSEGLVVVVLLVGIATLIPLFGTLRSSRQMLRDQHERVELLREERLALVEELELESRERRALIGTDAQPVENPEREQERFSEGSAQGAAQQEQRLGQALRGLQEELDRERRERQSVQRRAEELDLEHEKHQKIAQEMERLEQEHRRLREDLVEEREKLAETQHRAEGWDGERARLEDELQRLREELESQGRMPETERVERHLWRRRPALVAGLLFGALVAWFVSLVVALSLMAP